MDIIRWIFAISGAIGLAYGLNIILNREVQLYRKGAIYRYQGQAALLIGFSLILVATAAVIIAAFDITPVTMAIGIAFSLFFFVGRYFADRINDDPNLSLPSKK